MLRIIKSPSSLQLFPSNFDKECKLFEVFIIVNFFRDTQEELTKKLEEFRQQSRSSTSSFVERPRAKSEEVIAKLSGKILLKNIFKFLSFEHQVNVFKCFSQKLR